MNGELINYLKNLNLIIYFIKLNFKFYCRPFYRNDYDSVVFIHIVIAKMI